jgi:ATP synthase protein I
MSTLPKTLPGDLGPEEDSEQPYRRWSRAEVQTLIRPSISPWRVVAAQLLVGLATVAVVGLASRSAGPTWSALWGMVAVVVPGALMARGMTRSRDAGVGGAGPGALVFGFMFWELVKIATTVALLVLASRSVTNLSWLVMLVTMVVCMKVNWLALLWQGKRVRGEN